MSETAKPKRPDANPFAPPLPSKAKEDEKRLAFLRMEKLAKELRPVRLDAAEVICIVDQVTVHIAEAPDVFVFLPDQQAAPAVVALHAIGEPGGGRYAWRVQAPAVARFSNGVNPGDQPTIVLETVAAGVTLVEVRYMLGNLSATATVNVHVHVVSVSIQQAPTAVVLCHTGGNPPNTLPINAIGAPPGGTFAWTIANNGVTNFQNGANPGNQAAITLETVAAGTTNVDVTYTVGNVVATDTLTIDVVSLTLQQAPTAGVLCHMAGNGPNPLPLNATGSPRGGTYTWTIANQGVARPQNGAALGNQAAVTLESVAAGTTQVTVQYAVGGVTATASVAVDVVSVSIQQAPTAAVLCHVAPNGPNTLQLNATGTPAGGTYTWTIANNGVADFQNGVNPGNQAAITLETVAAGSTQVTVQYTAGGVTASATVTIEVVGVTLLPAPTAAVRCHVAPNGPNTRQLNATGTPAGGTYTWTIANNGVADFQNGVNPGNQAAITLKTVTAGSTQVTVQYDAAGLSATATTTVEVVGVRIQEGRMVGNLRVLGLIDPAAGPPTNQALTAVGTPGGGAPTWTALVPANIVDYAGGAATVNALNTSVDTVAQGTTTATVQYVRSGVTATASIELRVRDCGCSHVTWAPAGANVNASPVAGCIHGPAQGRHQQPHAPGGVATAQPAYPHHHGTFCDYCQQGGRDVYHYLYPFGAAVQDVTTLRNEIHALRGIFAAAGWAPGTPLPPAANVYLANHAWLASVPVWLYNPMGGQGIMLGVLRGVDAAGQPYRLRAVSGLFPGLALTAPTHGVPNAYWSRPLQLATRIYSASRVHQDYVGQGNTFGKCAAARLLAHAMLLSLQVESMAEIWLGSTQNGRVDGQLQASCNNCRVYLRHMLCDAGGGPRGAPVFINNVAHPLVPNRGM